MALLEASGIGKNFGDTKVLKDISLTLEQGEALAIIGSSGSGKTTLLRCLNFLERPDTGIIKVNGETMWDAADPATQRESEIRKKRLHFGLVFQNFNLFSNKNVLENCVIGQMKVLKKSRAEAEARAMTYLKKVGMDAFARAGSVQLSGGQKQRVAIARALASKPSIILADEPTGNLDSKTSDDVIGLLKMTSQQFHQTIVMITHNNEIAQLADRIIRIEDGRISE